MTTGYVPPTPTDPRPNEPERRTAPRVIALLTAALGIAVVVGAVLSAAVPTVAAAVSRSEEHSVDVEGVSDLDIDVHAMGLTIVFDDVDEASLEVRDSRGGAWTFERDDAVLRVATPRGNAMWWFGGGNGRATLTLPDDLAGLDAEVEVGGGSLDAEGEFGDLAVTLDAGQLTVSGTARDLIAEVNAGAGDLDLAGVATADLSLGAGELLARLTGSAPDEVIASVSAGSLELTLPDETYDLTTDVSAGSVDNGLRTNAQAPRTVFVEVAAGNAVLESD